MMTSCFFMITQGAIDDEDDGVDVEAMTYEELTALGEQIGTQSKGLCVEVIDALPVRRYVSTCGGGDGGGGGEVHDLHHALRGGGRRETRA